MNSRQTEFTRSRREVIWPWLISSAEEERKRQRQWSEQNVSGSLSGQTFTPRFVIMASSRPPALVFRRISASRSAEPSRQSRKTSTPTVAFFSRGGAAVCRVEAGVATHETPP